MSTSNKDSKSGSALVLLSGGQDSVTCLGLALGTYKTVHTIGFNYGQKHVVELKAARKICKMYNVPFVTHFIPSLAIIGDSALVTDGDTSKKHPRHNNLPSSFVPNRNALFLTISHAYAQKIGSDDIIIGVSQEDYSGYPDCRETFTTLFQDALNLGSNSKIKIATPLINLNKAAIFALARHWGFLSVVIEKSHTCYNGKIKRNEWGKGCGECPACVIRKNGYQKWLGFSV